RTGGVFLESALTPASLTAFALRVFFDRAISMTPSYCLHVVAGPLHKGHHETFKGSRLHRQRRSQERAVGGTRRRVCVSPWCGFTSRGASRRAEQVPPDVPALLRRGPHARRLRRGEA